MEIPAHTAEVLHKFEGVNVVKRGWLGDDAWFGSMVAALGAKKRLKVDSAWIIKGNHVSTQWGHYLLCSRLASERKLWDIR
jgi:hypothetical protein